jgi:HSP20 family protein
MMSSDARLWMWNEALALIARAERLQRRFFEPGISMQLANWEPPVDIFETEDNLWIVVALPGVEQGHLNLSMDANVLRVAGLRRWPFRALDQAAVW